MPLSLQLVLALGLAACTDLGESPAAREVSLRIEPQRALDLLFMIDNTFGTGEEQAAFNQSLPALLNGLRSGLPGGLPDLHAGVVTSDLGAPGFGSGPCARPGGDRGLFHVSDACGLAAGERFLKAPRAGAPSNGDLGAAEAIVCLARVGVLGCGYEHQLASITMALDPVITPENAGFLRPDAHLAIVLLSDEDDCSAPPDTTLFTDERPGQFASTRCALAGHLCNGVHPPAAPFTTPIANCEAAEDGPLIPVSTLVERVRAHKADPRRQISVAGVFGVPSAYPEADYQLHAWQREGLEYAAGCQSNNGEAYFGLRLAKFVASFGGGSTHDLCAPDPVLQFEQIGKTIAARMSSVCVPAPLTDCQILVGNTALPACSPDGPLPCWRFDPSPDCDETGLRLVLDSAGLLPAGPAITARCSRF